MIVEVIQAAGEFRKRAQTAQEADRLRHEAQVLDRARHPAVVELLRSEGDDLTLRLVEGRRLSEWVPGGGDEMAPIAVTAATTLADLHDIGVAHGAITAEHILINHAGTPILCSFGRGRTGAQVGRADRARDVVALARALLGATTRDSPLGQILAEVAGGAAGHAPTARRLATGLADGRSPRRRPAMGTAVLVLGAWTAVTIAVLVLPWVATQWAASDGGPAGTAPTAPPLSGRGWVGHPVGAPIGSPSLADPGCPAVDRGCHPLPGGIIETATGRYRVGGPGDVLVVGRWRCAQALVALLRPATGEVWAFDSWAGATGPVRAHLVTQIPGADLIQVDPGRSGCDRLRVLRRHRPALVVYPD